MAQTEAKRGGAVVRVGDEDRVYEIAENRLQLQGGWRGDGLFPLRPCCHRSRREPCASTDKFYIQVGADAMPLGELFVATEMDIFYRVN